MSASEQLLFLDSGDPDEIINIFKTGRLNGVTTNPSLCLKAGFQTRMEAEERLCELSRFLLKEKYNGPIPISLEQDVHSSTTA